MFRIILYLAGTLLTGYLSLLYPKPLIATLLALELLIFIPELLIAFYLSRCMRVDIRLPIPVTEKEQEAEVEILVENRGFLPVLNAKLKLEVKNQFHENAAIQNIRVQAGPKSKSVCRCAISSGNCGKLNIKIQRLWVGSMTGLFYFPAKAAKDTVSLAVMPHIVPMDIQVDQGMLMMYGDSEEYETTRGGDDPSEIFQIRDYRPGDRLQSIHWKMTARAEAPMVKEFSMPIPCAAVVFLDLNLRTGGGAFHHADDFMEKALSLCCGLLKASCVHYVVWYDLEGETLRRYQVKNEDNIYELLEHLFQARTYRESINLEAGYQEQYPYSFYAISYLLNTSLELWEGGGASCGNEKTLLS